jgi:hypothetical protein
LSLLSVRIHACHAILDWCVFVFVFVFEGESVNCKGVCRLRGECVVEPPFRRNDRVPLVACLAILDL